MERKTLQGSTWRQTGNPSPARSCPGSLGSGRIGPEAGPGATLAHGSLPISLGPRKSLASVPGFRATTQTSVNGQAVGHSPFSAFAWLQRFWASSPGPFNTTPTPLCISQPLWLNLCLQQSPQVRLQPHRPQGQGKWCAGIPLSGKETACSPDRAVTLRTQGQAPSSTHRIATHPKVASWAWNGWIGHF